MHTPVVAVLKMEKVSAFIIEKIPHTAGVPHRVPQKTMRSWNSMVRSVRDSYPKRSLPSLSMMNYQRILMNFIAPDDVLDDPKTMALSSIT
jgi:hypothetical protein